MNRKSALAQLYDNYNPSGSRPRFEDFKKQKAKTKRRYVIVFLGALLLCTVSAYLFQNKEEKRNEHAMLSHSQQVEIQDHTQSQMENDGSFNTSNSSKHIQKKNSYVKHKISDHLSKRNPVFGKEVDMPLTQIPHGGLNLYFKPCRFAFEADRLEFNILDLIPVTPKTNSTKGKSFSLLSIGTNAVSNGIILEEDASRYIHPDYKKIYNETQNIKPSFSIQYAGYIPISKHWFISVGMGMSGNSQGGVFKFELDSVPVYDIDNSIAGFVVYPDGSPLKFVDLGSGVRSFYTMRSYVHLAYGFDKWGVTFLPELGTAMSLIMSPKGNEIDVHNLKKTIPLKDVILPFAGSISGRLTALKPLKMDHEMGISVGTYYQIGTLYKFDKLNMVQKAMDIQLVYKFKL